MMVARSRPLFDEDHEAYRASVRRFLVEAVVPHLDAWRIAGRVPDDVLAAAGDQGFLGTAAPEELGGGGVDDLRFTAVLVEETAAVGATGLALTFAMHAGVCLPLLLEHADAAQQASWVPALASGQAIGTVAGASAPIAAELLDAVLHVDAVIDGVTAGVLAGLVLTPVVVDGDVRVLLLPTDEDLVSRRHVVDSLAARDAGQADLVIAGVVDAACLVPGADDAVGQVMRDLDLWSAVLGVAAARAVLDLTLDYVRERKVFGRPLAEFENTRHVLAEIAAGIESAQLFVDTALEHRAAGTLTAAEAAVARLGAGSIHDRSVDQGMQLHGGYGYMREYPISHAFADARYLRNQGSLPGALDAVAAGLGI